MYVLFRLGERCCHDAFVAGPVSNGSKCWKREISSSFTLKRLSHDLFMLDVRTSVVTSSHPTFVLSLIRFVHRITGMPHSTRLLTFA